MKDERAIGDEIKRYTKAELISLIEILCRDCGTFIRVREWLHTQSARVCNSIMEERKRLHREWERCTEKIEKIQEGRNLIELNPEEWTEIYRLYEKSEKILEKEERLDKKWEKEMKRR